jgi:hypothetical protein
VCVCVCVCVFVCIQSIFLIHVISLDAIHVERKQSPSVGGVPVSGMALISPISSKVFSRFPSTSNRTKAASLFVLENLVSINSIELIALSVCAFPTLQETLSRRLLDIASICTPVLASSLESVLLPLAFTYIW